MYTARNKLSLEILAKRGGVIWNKMCVFGQQRKFAFRKHRQKTSGFPMSNIKAKFLLGTKHPFDVSWPLLLLNVFKEICSLSQFTPPPPPILIFWCQITSFKSFKKSDMLYKIHTFKFLTLSLSLILMFIKHYRLNHRTF